MRGVIQEKCPLPCNQTAMLTYLGHIQESPWNNWIQVECQCCGKFLIDGTFEALWGTSNRDRISNEDLNLLYYLPAHTRQSSERKETIRIDENNWREFAQIHKNTTIIQRSKKLLEYIQSQSQTRGANVRIETALEYPVIDATSAAEFEDLLEHLEKYGYIKQQRERE